MKHKTNTKTRTINETELFQMLQTESGRKELLALAEALQQEGMADAEDVRALKAICESTPIQQPTIQPYFNPMDVVKL